ncbi:Flp pilus assembly protein TadG [Rhodovulum iodosum]|uniref:Flp pilus assembly protein TadG n=2 Tax=Rhodovulum iodosum TaxID=68291 RepID=A0ABV3XWK0_9RHOB|nr:pilus assembly protein TadG-related protein [Rhodovulum robiginosum]RSK34200.1 hypothetical protein EJA01_08770 [Rhodovulum robiginosum]
MERRSKIAQFAHSTKGSIAVLWAMSLVVLLGLVALSFDFGRMASTQAELQSYADHVALAAGGELDGKSDAITRAQAAAANLVSDSQTFAEGVRALSGDTNYTLSFHSSLPSSDLSAVGSTTTDPALASYVRVLVNTRNVRYTFYSAFNALLDGTTPADAQVNAVAVAGYTQYACDVTPLMFCLPEVPFPAEDNVGRLIQLRSGGNGAGAWGPGDFGFLLPLGSGYDISSVIDDEGACSGLSSAVQIASCIMGAYGNLARCYSTRGVDVMTGQGNGLTSAAFNTRFDLYRATMTGERNVADFAPAPNVIKGIIPNGGGSCIGNRERPSPTSMGLPRDNCFYPFPGTCTNRVGSGNWSDNCNAYFQTNYVDNGVAIPAWAAGACTWDPLAGEMGMTRWEVYKAEIDAAGGLASTTPLLNSPDETGRGSCSSQPQIQDYDRRMVIAAGIDCVSHPINGRATDVPVEEYYKVFMTEPVGDDGTTPPNVDIWGEIIGSAGGSGAGSGGLGSVFHDVVQLYR